MSVFQTKKNKKVGKPMKIKNTWSIIQTNRVNEYNENNSPKIKIMAIDSDNSEFCYITDNSLEKNI